MGGALEAPEKMDRAAGDHRTVTEAVADTVEPLDEALGSAAVIGFEKIELRRPRGREA